MRRAAARASALAPQDGIGCNCVSFTVLWLVCGPLEYQKEYQGMWTRAREGRWHPSHVVVVVAILAYARGVVRPGWRRRRRRPQTDMEKPPIVATSPEAMGERALEQGDDENAIRLFSAAVRQSRSKSQALVGRAVANYRAGHYPEAIADCSEAVRLDPRCADALGMRVRVPRTQGDREGVVGPERRDSGRPQPPVGVYSPRGARALQTLRKCSGRRDESDPTRPTFSIGILRASRNVPSYA